MMRAIDVLIVIEDDHLAKHMYQLIVQSAPTAITEKVPSFSKAIELVRVCSVRLFIFGPLSHTVVGSATYELTSESPETLVQVIPVALLVRSYPNKALTKWSQMLCNTIIEKKTLNSRAVIVQQNKALASMKEAVFNCDKYLNVTYINRAAETLTGLNQKDVLGMPLTSIMRFDPNIIGDKNTLSLDKLSQGGSVNTFYLGSTIVHHKDEKNAYNTINLLFDDKGECDGAVIVTLKSDNHYSKLYHQANYDWLTDLPNRALLTERLNRLIQLAMRHHHQVGLMFIDLDNFKLVNDSLGHDAGDQLLRSVSKRLISCVRASDTVSRLAGDEFAILLSENFDYGDFERVATKILSAFSLPHQLGKKAYVMGLSIGVSIYPLDANCHQSMYLHADEAMFKAKRNGGNSFEIYTTK